MVNHVRVTVRILRRKGVHTLSSRKVPVVIKGMEGVAVRYH